MPTMKWHGPQVIAEVHKGIAENIERAARGLRDNIKEHISEPSPPPSAPGEDPHKQTHGGGHLRRGIAMEMDKRILVARVGTNVLYGKFLEFGTIGGKGMLGGGWRMRPRPWLTNALRRYHGQIMKFLKNPIKGGQ